MSSRLWKIYTMWKFLFFSGSTYPNGVGYWETGFLYLKTSGDPGSQLPPTKDVPSDDFWDNRLTCLLGRLHPGTTYGFTAPHRLTVQSSLDSPPRACESTWSGKGIIYLFSFGPKSPLQGKNPIFEYRYVQQSRFTTACWFLAPWSIFSNPILKIVDSKHMYIYDYDGLFFICICFSFLQII